MTSSFISPMIMWLVQLATTNLKSDTQFMIQSQSVATIHSLWSFPLNFSVGAPIKILKEKVHATIKKNVQLIYFVWFSYMYDMAINTVTTLSRVFHFFNWNFAYIVTQDHWKNTIALYTQNRNIIKICIISSK